MVLLKKFVYDELVAKVNNIDNSGIVLKTNYDSDKSDLENKISDADKKITGTSRLVVKTGCNTKVIEREKNTYY